MDVVSTKKNIAETAPNNSKERDECCCDSVVVDYPFEPWKSNLDKWCSIAKK